MKKLYVEPEAEVIEINASVFTNLTASGDGTNETEFDVNNW